MSFLDLLGLFCFSPNQDVKGIAEECTFYDRLPFSSRTWRLKPGLRLPG